MKQIMLTNSLTGRKELFVPHAGHKVSLYVCGITPYDYAHVGHGRCYVTFDVVFRLLAFTGLQVTYVRNFTDIDDKLLARAQQEFNNPGQFKEIADRFIAAFQFDMKQLNCLPPTLEPRVTDAIPQIITFIQGLIEKGYAYEVKGDVYFSIDAFAGYGELSKRTSEDLTHHRIETNEKKRNPADFALWKAEQPDTFWPSPWGWGRPGWHVECSVMCRMFLGDVIDIHGGGMDLLFPHHENERAQTEALTGKLFVRYWMHVAFVQVQKEKMSKSLGNFFTLHDVMQKYDPMTVRFMYLSHHYRNPLDFSDKELELAQKGYQKLCKLFAQIPPIASERSPHILIQESKIASAMLEMLCDDINTQGAFGVLFEQQRLLKTMPHEYHAARFVIEQLMGLELKELREEATVITPEIEKLLADRETARALRDWARSDELRDQLKSLGYTVQDKKLEKS